MAELIDKKIGKGWAKYLKKIEKMYKKNKMVNSSINSIKKLEGETIENKIERIISNGEAITDGAPEIFTERKEGVLAAYNIRTDRFEIACEAMDKVQGSIQAKRDNAAKENSKPAGEPKKDDKVESIQGDQKGGVDL